MLNKLIKDLDHFGYHIGLNFNNSGNTHNTIPGGIISILLYIGVIIYTIILLLRIDNREYDTLTTVTKPATQNTFQKRSYE